MKKIFFLVKKWNSVVQVGKVDMRESTGDEHDGYIFEELDNKIDFRIASSSY